jgi:hypothetical protein
MLVWGIRNGGHAAMIAGSGRPVVAQNRNGGSATPSPVTKLDTVTRLASARMIARSHTHNTRK